jgi:hypothetical protein
MGKQRSRHSVKFLPHPPDFSLTPLPALMAAASGFFLTSCTTREELSGVRTSYSFDEGAWGSKLQEDDSAEIREKFAESGWRVDEDGNIIPTREKNRDMFSGDTFRGSDKKIGEKKARLTGNTIDGKVIDTPEYLSRQKEFATGESKDGGKMARESLLDKFRSKESDKTADIRGKSWTEKLGLFPTKPARESGKGFKASENRELAKSGREAVKPTSRQMPSGGGFYRDSDMSIDEVRELVSPDGFMR